MIYRSIVPSRATDSRRLSLFLPSKLPFEYMYPTTKTSAHQQHKTSKNDKHPINPTMNTKFREGQTQTYGNTICGIR